MRPSIILVSMFKAWMVIERIARLRGIYLRIRLSYWKARLQYLGYRTVLHSCIKIHSPDMVCIGSDCSIAEFVHIWGGGKVIIGNKVLIASHEP